MGNKQLRYLVQKVRMRLEFEPRDLWVGLFWKADKHNRYDGLQMFNKWHFYFCVIPMLPLHITVTTWWHSDA